MGLIDAGSRVAMSDTSRVQPGGIGFNFRAGSGNRPIRGFYVQNVSAVPVYIRVQGRQPGSIRDAQIVLPAYEHHAAPVDATTEIWISSALNTAEFIIALWDEPIPFFHVLNPASVPVSAAVKIEDGVTAGRYATVDATGHLLVEFDAAQQVSVTGNVAGTNAAGSQVNGHSVTLGSTTDAGVLAGDGSVIAQLKGILARAGSILTALGGGLPAALTALGYLKVAALEVATVGAQGNAWNAAAVGAGGDSAAIDCQYTPYVSALVDVDAATTIELWASQDNAAWFATGLTIVFGGAGSGMVSTDSGIRYHRLRSSGAATITATIAGKGG